MTTDLIRGLAVALVLCAAPLGAVAQEPALLGTWGTQAQCTRQTILPGGSVRAAPYEISEGWLRHGTFWCRLSWFPAQERPRGVYASVVALCGEDAVRTHTLAFVLEGGILRMAWNESLLSPPMQRCPSG